MISCSASFLGSTTYAKHETTTPAGVFLWSVSFCCPTACQLRKYTIYSVISCSASFLGPTTYAKHEMTLLGVILCLDPLEVHSRGVYYIFYVLLNSHYKYIVKYILCLWEFGRNPAPVVAGREFCGYGCGGGKNSPRDTHVHHYQWPVIF